ncbi:MAG: septum formation initiator family protein [Actinomycetota bacterium]|nr:septum formation initiator family protein [Actinomycetota bacterium]
MSSARGGTRNAGHKTSSIPRPSDATRAGQRNGGKDSTRGGEFTRPIARDKQLVKGRGKRGVIWTAAMVITAALVAALFVLPVKAWLRQQDDIERKEQELAALDLANAELADEVAKLQTPAGIEEAAREEIGYVRRGEIRLTVLPAPQAPITMPDGWPYDAVAQIVSVRSQGTINP